MKEEIIRYVEFSKHLAFVNTGDLKNIGPFIEKTLDIMPGKTRKLIAGKIRRDDFKAMLRRKDPHKKSYNTFYLNLLDILIRQSGFSAGYINPKYIDKSFLPAGIKGPSTYTKDKIIADHVAFLVKTKTANLFFSFGHQGAKCLSILSRHICSIDNNRFRDLHVIVFRNDQEMHRARQADKASLYKRSFFTSFDEICRQAMERDSRSCEKILSLGRYMNKTGSVTGAGTESAEILSNVPVGKKPHRLYKLTFKTAGSLDIAPGQFIMISTTTRKNRCRPRVVDSVSSVKPCIQNGLQAKPVSFLKRPFGIYQARFEHFPVDYLSRLRLEKELAGLIYTLLPDTFELVYKVLENGVGTNELTRLRKADKIEMLAPLGKFFDVRKLAGEEPDEIHIVGGGVGIAPLIYMVQALKFLHCKVKAFIGIESFDTVIYKDRTLAKGAGSAAYASIYIDDLVRMGLSETSDIYVSLLCHTDEDPFRGIRHIYKGSLVTEPYAEYLRRHSHLKIHTFSCGPLPMMKKVHELTARYGIPSHVLMEKRMACGIGVCFSCVCKTMEDGVNHNTRVCIEGPVMESKQINWNE